MVRYPSLVCANHLQEKDSSGTTPGKSGGQVGVSRVGATVVAATGAVPVVKRVGAVVEETWELEGAMVVVVMVGAAVTRVGAAVDKTCEGATVGVRVVAWSSPSHVLHVT